MTPSACQTDLKRCQSPASRQTTQFSKRSRISRRSSLTEADASLIAPYPRSLALKPTAHCDLLSRLEQCLLFGNAAIAVWPVPAAGAERGRRDRGLPRLVAGRCRLPRWLGPYRPAGLAALLPRRRLGRRWPADLGRLPTTMLPRWPRRIVRLQIQDRQTTKSGLARMP